MACVTVERVTQLMKEAAEQHHKYEDVLKAHMVEAGQLEAGVSWTDPEWPMWYSRYIVTQLAIDAERASAVPFMQFAKPTVGELKAESEMYGQSLRLDEA